MLLGAICTGPRLSKSPRRLPLGDAKDVNEFALTIESIADGTQPNVTTYGGVSVTPAQNAYDAYAQVIAGSSVTDECQEIEIHISGIGASTAARDGMVTIGFDLAGGTSYTDKIVDLVCGPAARTGGGDGQECVKFMFPLRVPAGCSIGAKASVNSATLTAIRVKCVLRGRPTHPEHIWVGNFVTTFGADITTSAGTAITPGGASDSAWLQLGSALTTPLHYWEFGYGINDATMQQGEVVIDIGLGDASNKRRVIANAEVFTQSIEIISKAPQGRYAHGAVGDIVYARAQRAGTPDSANSIAVYGVG